MVSISEQAAKTALLLIKREMIEYAILDMRNLQHNKEVRDALVAEYDGLRIELEHALGYTADEMVNEYRARQEADNA